jgi:predicted CoA-binding protein
MSITERPHEYFDRPQFIIHNSSNIAFMRSVVILGAPTDRNKFGNKSRRADQQKVCAVYPINPHETEIEAARVYKSVSDVPVWPHIVTIYLPPEELLPLLVGIAAKGCDELWFNPGTESDAVLAEAKRVGLHVVQACSIVGLGMSPDAL